MLLIFIILYMADYITTFKNDINIFINDLMEKKIIQDFDFKKLSIDYSSNSFEVKLPLSESKIKFKICA